MAKQPLPLFYTRPRLLKADSDTDLSLSAVLNYGFAAKTNSVPLNGVELAIASKDYPIVFAGSDVNIPVALLGFRADRNEFVESDGQWSSGVYVPAYVRRYPFIFLESPSSDTFALCIDEAAPSVKTGRDNPLFINGQPTDVTKRALEFCQAYQGHHRTTAEFCAAVASAGLLEERRADIAMASGEKLSLNGFRVIDEAKFNALPDDVFLQWRAKGWVQLVYCHLLSMNNWGRLIDRTARAGVAA
ncbi:MAG: SapC family protein [Rhodospirillaceae bacterium]